MDSARWRQIEELFHAALACELEARREFVRDKCGRDLELLRELESMLARADEAGSFLETDLPDTEKITPAARLEGYFGPYRILAPIGAGGMGEVYRANDSKLGRDVALKALPPAFANDAQRLARFRREARTLASLNHPNIGMIHGLEEFNGAIC